MKKKPAPTIQWYVLHWYKNYYRIRWYGLTKKDALIAWTDLQIVWKTGLLLLVKGDLQKFRH